ncbi:AAA family ATPase [Acidisoma sp. S159]|uniref:AAA family ATPase n=1 Tax=Acidisoma sp. S159 TaxID=1747225 RepID=UPI0020B11DA5|nr:AAA family ATPase [Acidisoma sp. S159]
MKVLEIWSEKGGAGKSTLTIHIAVAAKLAGLKVAIIDIDPQASSADWADQRGSEPEAVAIPSSRLDKLLSDLRANGDMDLVIIDTPREANNAGYIAALAADFVLVPFKRGGFDFRALKRTIDSCLLAKKRPCLLLNGMRIGATRVEADVREALVEHECDIAPVVFHDRAPYVTASITGFTAQETEPDSAAAAEIGELFTWISRQLGLSTTRQRDKKAVSLSTTKQRDRKAAA